MYLGLDIGSSSSKAVVLDKNGNIAGESVINIGTGSRGPQVVIEEALGKANVTKEQIKKTVVTGYGRMTFKDADKQVTEISCHAKGVTRILPETRTIIDIGGQDAKVIKVDSSSNVKNFVMNEKCAAGTGRFLEVMARVLDTTIGELSDMAAKGADGVSISSTCTVFAESEMISQLAAGKKVEDVALGAHKSIAQRVAGLANRIGITPTVVMSGGVALNSSVIKAVEEEIDFKIARLKSPQTMGALGAAVYAMEIDI
ncbi:MAG TPA: acyl-CoA dehydratase activase [Anaerovoracaceae bacterium]|nr:acyl-CoA dehydratase activase [Anaerovoracaceae bacterium]